MSGQDRTQTCIWPAAASNDASRCGLPAALFATVILAAALICTGCKKQPAEQTNTEHQQEQRETSPVRNAKRARHIQQKTNISNGASLSLNDIIKSRRYWDPAYMSWYGKTAPDFTLADITGKQHKLSDYRGKDVMIIFWATWCGPCIIEIPHLIELRNTTDEDKLAMLAISNERPDLVKKFVANKKLNYSVLLDEGTMPTPFNLVEAIPCSFFIDSQGKIKLATIGVLSSGVIKAILQAEPP